MSNGHTTAMAVREPYVAARPTTTALAPIEPGNMAELVTFAAAAAKSRLFGVDSPEQALMISMAGRDLGFSYSQALRAFHVVKGKPTLSADGMVAACLASGHCEYFRAVEVTEESATWETKRKGSQPRRYAFTMADARKAGIANDMYAKHPKRMLSARAKSYLARDEYPDVLLGLLEEDEAYEIAARREPAQTLEVVTQVTDARRPPPEPRREPDWAALANEAEGAIVCAETVDQLDAVGAEIKRQGFTGELRASLGRKFATRKAELAKAAAEAAVPVAEETRENFE